MVVSKEGKAVKLYAQEPAFTTHDVSFLTAFSIAVLTSGIESQITTTSFVFAPFVDWDLLLPIFLKDKDPQLYLGNDILKQYDPFAGTEGKKSVLEECNAIGQEFITERDFVKVPEFDLHEHALRGLVLSWRKLKDED